MQFELIRLMLLRRAQVSLFERRGEGGAVPSREEWLREIFAKPINFDHQKLAFHYVPADAPDPRFIVGRIGRRLSVKENEPPEAGLQETERKAWKAVTVLIDPRAHDDGQKAAIERDRNVAGTPVALLRSLAAHLNAMAVTEPYVMEVNGIIDPETFWVFVRANRGRVMSVTFELVAPNMFGQRDDLDREMKELRDHEKARRAMLSIQNEDGLELETERVRRTAEYTSEGGGSIRAIAKGRKYFSSTNRARRVKVPKDEAEPSDARSFLLRALARVFQL